MLSDKEKTKIQTLTYKKVGEIFEDLVNDKDLDLFPKKDTKEIVETRDNLVDQLTDNVLYWAEINQKPQDLGKGYICTVCYKYNIFTAYVYAHWNIPLVHTCECGAIHNIQSGSATLK